MITELGKEMIKQHTLVDKMAQAKEIVWINPELKNVSVPFSIKGMTVANIEEAEAKLKRFAPLLRKIFPETRDTDGIIESELTEIPMMKERLNADFGSKIEGRLFLKRDSDLPIAGSIKARGGIYEVLKHTEELAIENGLLQREQKTEIDYSVLAEEDCRQFFRNYTIQVGSTGNLGMSIGIMSAALGYRAIVHMSADAKQWKKDLLRSKGVIVKEYETDYTLAVENGRKQSQEDPKSYFVDDENSVDLFLGYSVAAKRLVPQLLEKGITVDEDHPLFVYIPCGIGGAPGGVTFGLKQVFGNNVHCFFVEPVQAPCMALGMMTGLNSEICVQDIGLTGKTEADGLAVGRPSGFVGEVMKPLLSGEFTLQDDKLYQYMQVLLDSENLFIEPSAAAIFEGAVKLAGNEETQKYLREKGLDDKMKNATHICWATGGKLVPEPVRREYANIAKKA